MPTRHRTRDLRYVISGSYQTFGAFPSILVQSQLVGENKVCDDYVTAPKVKRVDNALLIVTSDTKLTSWSGRFPISGPITKQLSSCPSDYKPAPPDPISKYGALSAIQQSSLAWESLAATNPNVAHVSLPTFAAELKDLPMLWRQWGDKQLARAQGFWKKVLASKHPNDRAFVRAISAVRNNPFQSVANYRTMLQTAPAAHIWWRWGVAPLLSDIDKMFGFERAINQRMQWLQALGSGTRVLKRKATLRNTTDTDTPTTVQIKSVGANIQGRRTVIYTEKVWCTVQWKLAQAGFIIPGLSQGSLDLDKLRAKARELTFGWTTQDALSALWEIMPWSWFADWFLHLQTVMDATKSTVPVTWGSICLMRHTTADAIVTPLDSSADLAWCKPSGYHHQSGDRKQRLLVSPILPFAPSMLPVFTTGQWSILGSLAILRSVR